MKTKQIAMYAAIAIALYLLLIRPASNLGRQSGPSENYYNAKPR